MRKRINYDRLSSVTPVVRTDDSDDDVRNLITMKTNNCYKLLAWLTANLWTEAGLVNSGACRMIVCILKPPDDREACPRGRLSKLLRPSRYRIVIHPIRQ